MLPVAQRQYEPATSEIPQYYSRHRRHHRRSRRTATAATTSPLPLRRTGATGLQGAAHRPASAKDTGRGVKRRNNEKGKRFYRSKCGENG
jgi:hypothetical protein